MGSSETRTIRIPRADERDSVAIEQLPPTPVDKRCAEPAHAAAADRTAGGADSANHARDDGRRGAAHRRRSGATAQAGGGHRVRTAGRYAEWLSTRTFPGDGHNHSAEELAAAPTPEAVLKAAERATGGVSGMLDEHGDETPVVAVNRPLLEAYNAMWDADARTAGRRAARCHRTDAACGGGHPACAVGGTASTCAATPPAAVVDLAKVRLIGTDSARAEARKALAALPAPERLLAERVLHAMTLVTARDAAAIDSLRLIRLDALGAAPALATALQDLVSAVSTRGRMPPPRCCARDGWRCCRGSRARARRSGSERRREVHLRPPCSTIPATGTVPRSWRRT